MSKDTVIPAPSTIFFDAKDKIIGTPGTLHNPQSGELEYDRARPDTIAGEISQQLDWKSKQITTAENFHQDTFNLKWDQKILRKAKNTVNSVRAFGDMAPVNQNARFRAADDLTRVMLGSPDYGLNLPPEVEKKNALIEKTRLHIAAALGHKKSLTELQRQAQTK